MIDTRPINRLRGWKLFAALAGGVLALTAASAALAPDSVGALQHMLRLTARTSFVLFLAAFAASSLLFLGASPFSKLLMRERRYIGLAFAFSHFVHAVLVVIYAKQAPAAFWQGRTPGSLASGIVVYVLIALMALTSFKGPARMIGPRAWQVLHRVGVWAIGLAFALGFYQRIAHEVNYAWPFALMMLAVLLRAYVRAAKLVAARRRASASEAA